MKPSLLTAMSLMMLLFLKVAGGRLEGRLFPVTSPGLITRTEVVDDTRTRFWGMSKRIRNCTFVRLEWALHAGSQAAVVDLRFEESEKVRGQGVFDFGPWIVELRPDQLLERSSATVYHRCHAFWLTETVFYTPH